LKANQEDREKRKAEIKWMDEWASFMRPRPNLKCCSAKEEEDGNL